MKAGTQFWLKEAAEIESIMDVRDSAISVELLKEDLEWARNRAWTMEEWKNNVESQRQGLEAQVGEIERQRQSLESWVNEIERQRQGLEVQVGEIERQRRELEEKCNALAAQNEAKQAELDKIYASRGWRLLKVLWKIEAFFLPPNSWRRRCVAKIARVFRKK